MVFEHSCLTLHIKYQFTNIAAIVPPLNSQPAGKYRELLELLQR
jgi:hypothetical protein